MYTHPITEIIPTEYPQNTHRIPAEYRQNTGRILGDTYVQRVEYYFLVVKAIISKGKS
jgi:hypothetical protein